MHLLRTPVHRFYLETENRYKSPTVPDLYVLRIVSILAIGSDYHRHVILVASHLSSSLLDWEPFVNLTETLRRDRDRLEVISKIFKNYLRL